MKKMAKNNDLIHIRVYATDLKKSAIKRIMRELGYPGCDPGRFGLDDPRTIVGITSFSREGSKVEGD